MYLLVFHNNQGSLMAFGHQRWFSQSWPWNSPWTSSNVKGHDALLLIWLRWTLLLKSTMVVIMSLIDDPILGIKNTSSETGIPASSARNWIHWFILILKSLSLAGLCYATRILLNVWAGVGSLPDFKMADCKPEVRCSSETEWDAGKIAVVNHTISTVPNLVLMTSTLCDVR